jgi:hypothetical protein
MLLNTENQLDPSFLKAKNDELHFLDQIYKYTKHLECMYKSGKLQDKNKAFYTEISLSNINSEREKVQRDIEEIVKYESLFK